MASGLIGQILRFGAVGGVGFVVDGSLLALLIRAGFDPYLARALSFPVAVVVTWALNRNWTFRESRDASSKGQFRRYFAVQVVGTLTNYAVYSIFITAFGTAPAMIFWGFALGSAVGSALNFAGARYIAFRVGAS